MDFQWVKRYEKWNKEKIMLLPTNDGHVQHLLSEEINKVKWDFFSGWFICFEALSIFYGDSHYFPPPFRHTFFSMERRSDSRKCANKIYSLHFSLSFSRSSSWHCRCAPHSKTRIIDVQTKFCEMYEHLSVCRAEIRFAHSNWITWFSICGISPATHHKKLNIRLA